MDAPPHNDPFRVYDEPFDLSREERMRHVLVVGKSGVGKSTFLFNTVLADIESGAGAAFIDPHGDEAERLIDAIPDARTNDVIYLNLADRDFPVAFNPLAGVPLDERPARAAAIVAAFAHIWRDAWGHSSAQVVRNAVATLMDTPGLSLVALPRLLTDAEFRGRLAARATDPLVRAYWRDQFDAYKDDHRNQKIAPVQNKIEELLAEPRVRNILAAGTNLVDLRAIIDGHKILICNLAKGLIGESAANLVGSLLVSLIGVAAISRADTPEEEREDFLLAIDEFPAITTTAFASLLSEVRKYRLGLLAASQFLDQCAPEVRASFLANAAALVVFAVGPTDAEHLAPHFGKLDPIELTDQPIGQAWVHRERPFSGWSGSRRAKVPFPMRQTPRTGRRDVVVARSRRMYARPRAHVERLLYRYF